MYLSWTYKYAANIGLAYDSHLAFASVNKNDAKNEFTVWNQTHLMCHMHVSWTARSDVSEKLLNVSNQALEQLAS